MSAPCASAVLLVSFPLHCCGMLCLLERLYLLEQLVLQFAINLGLVAILELQRLPQCRSLFSEELSSEAIADQRCSAVLRGAYLQRPQKLRVQQVMVVAGHQVPAAASCGHLDFGMQVLQQLLCLAHVAPLHQPSRESWSYEGLPRGRQVGRIDAADHSCIGHELPVAAHGVSTGNELSGCRTPCELLLFDGTATLLERSEIVLLDH
mmetsp:Transcript_25066/g.58333  ORF Transcript_25066/g.58333 Transcript_25066/m.58333 type:complete len:207 (+) Transcript_25066:405-1025(+)